MKVVLFGLGLFYELYKECFTFFDIVALVDNDKRKQNTVIDGVEVIAPDKLKNIEFDKIFLLIAAANLPDMKKQLNAIGVPTAKISTVYDIRNSCNDIGENYPLQIITSNFTEMMCTKKRLRIGVYHPVRGQSVNGVDTCLIQLCKVLTKYAEIHVVISRECDLIDILLKYGVTVIIDKYSHIKRFDDISWYNAYDLIFVNSVDMFNLFDGVKEISKPVVWWLHTIGESVAQVPLRRLENISNINLHVYAVSPLTKMVFNSALPEWKIKILLYGIEKGKSYIGKQTYKNKIIFAIVGRCNRGKGQDILVEAVKMMTDEVKKKCEFWLVGYMNKSRSYEMEILKEVKEEECFKIIGSLYNEDLNEMYNKIDVLLCPSRADAMPIVCAEAMMHYHPCIVSENVGTKFLIKEKENGLICKMGDSVDLKNKIEWCINNRDKIAQMGEKARAVYEQNFTMSKFEENVLRIINNLCK